MLLDDIAGYLEQKGLGTREVNLFLGKIPDQPDNCICLFEYAGKSPERLVEGLEYPGLQVRVRNKSYSAGRQTIEGVYRALHCLANADLGSSFYLNIFANQSPEPLGRDQNDRMEFVQNFAVTKTKEG